MKGEACLAIAFLPRKGDPLLPMCCFRDLPLLAGSDQLETLEPCGWAALWILPSAAGVLPPALPLATLPISVRRGACTIRSLVATCCVKRRALTHTTSALLHRNKPKPCYTGAFPEFRTPHHQRAVPVGHRRLHHCHTFASSWRTTASDALKLLPSPEKEEMPKKRDPSLLP